MSTENAGSNLPSNDAAADWLRQIRQASRKCDEANGTLRNIYKRAKSDGMNVASMRSAIKLARLDRDEVVTDLSDQLRYMSILRMPLAAADIFDWDAEVTEKTAREDDMWDAGDKGYHAGRHGVPIEDAPYQPGTELHVSWLAAWREGQAAIAEEMGPKVEAASASRKRPGGRTTSTEQPETPAPAAVRAARGARRNGAAARH